jgi:hypothetical protein
MDSCQSKKIRISIRTYLVFVEQEDHTHRIMKRIRICCVFSDSKNTLDHHRDQQSVLDKHHIKQQLKKEVDKSTHQEGFEIVVEADEQKKKPP